MPMFQPFLPARREDIPDYIKAAYLQGQGELQVQELKDQQKRDRNALPGELYGTYSEVTGTNPLTDAITRAKEAKTLRDANAPASMSQVGGSGTSSITQGANGPAQLSKVGGPPQAAASKITPVMSGSAGSASGASMQGLTAAQAGQQMSTMMPASTVVGQGSGQAANLGSQAAGSAAGAAGTAAVPIVGGAISAALTAQGGGSQRDQVKSGVGSAATGALATYAAPLAAAGPVGWAGIAALAAASLYGMLG